MKNVFRKLLFTVCIIVHLKALSIVLFKNFKKLEDKRREKYCRTGSQSIPELKNKIIRVIGEIEPQLCQNVVQSFYKRVDICGAARGNHLADIVFCV